MATPFLIAPFSTGEQTNLTPWMIPEQAFEVMEDAYVWRGRVVKRLGYSLLGTTALFSRLRIQVGVTDGAGAAAFNVPGSIFKVGQAFSVGDEIFTVYQTGAPAAMLATAGAAGTYNTATGATTIAGAAINTAIFFYPAEPVMGLRLREQSALNFELTVGFDTQFAYQFVGGAWDRLGTALWTSSDIDFFWTTNFRGANPEDTFFYVVNGLIQGLAGEDGIKYLPEGSAVWVNLRPQLDSGGAPTRFLETCQVLVGFKDRLVALNTIETDTGVQLTFKSRARWSQNGDPTAPATSWLDDAPGRGGYLDAPTKEAIVTADLFKDRLVVYFERSTWELVYTADDQLPFRWERINSELGSESTYSVIGFDQAAIGVGNVGIHACSGSQVTRIDEEIPDLVFDIHNGNDGVKRVYGIRDYQREMLYWTFPDATTNPVFPTRVLIFNYETKSWGFMNDSFTCFGYLQYTSDLSWATVGFYYGTWANWNSPWNSGSEQSQFPWVVSGNQEGFTFRMDPYKSSNSRSLQITNMAAGQITIIDHNLPQGSFVIVRDCVGVTSLNNQVVQVAVVDADTITVDVAFSGTYLGGGTVERVSGLNVRSKQWQPGVQAASRVRFPFVDLLLARTSLGEISLDYAIDYGGAPEIGQVALGNSFLGSPAISTAAAPILGTSPPTPSVTWHRYFMQSLGQSIQLIFSLSADQIRNYAVATSKFELHATILHVEQQGRIAP